MESSWIGEESSPAAEFVAGPEFVVVSADLLWPDLTH